MGMNRRHFILTGAAFALAGAAPFRPARFSVELGGSGPDVLLIPGLTAGREIWRATAEALPGHRFHLLQVAGFAGEPARGNRAGPLLSPLAEEIARYIAEAGLVRAAIVGHSMGGTLAMLVAARHPALLGRIMVVDMLPEPAALFGGSAAGWAPLARMAATPGGSRVLAGLLAAFSPPGSSNRNSDPEVVGRATRELIAADLTPLLPQIRAPMTIVYAVPNSGARRAIDHQFASAYATARNARLVRIDNSGHMVMLDQPARFRAALRTFLRG
jgi:pimeloyl-ACP methyl ester carboxylesterase